MCDCCKAIGHTRDGYPEWFKQLRNKKGNSSKAHINLAKSPLKDNQVTDKKGNGTKLSPALSELVQREVNKILKGEQSRVEQVNFYGHPILCR